MPLDAKYFHSFEANGHIKSVSIPDQVMGYRFIISADGITGAFGRPLWIMSSNSVLYSYSGHTQWFTPILKPYRNFVPITSLNDIKHSAFLTNYRQAERRLVIS
jgi:hypothetical protein